MVRVLIGSPVRQEPSVLKLFLHSISRLHASDLALEFCFIDDNTVAESSVLLSEFAQARSEVTILPGDCSPEQDYSRDALRHRWTYEAVWRVARYKNTILDLARKRHYDFVFLVDSDLVLHPRTLECLLRCSRDVVSEVFWTRWQPGQPELPQVWVSGQYELFERDPGEQLNQHQIQERTRAFLAKLLEPGIYRVGGLGACTLISRRALSLGVSFEEVYNVPFSGEDRHFCVRAASLGLDLWVDTHFPAYHVYRPEDLDGALSFLRLTESDDELVRVSTEVMHLYGSTSSDQSVRHRAFTVLAPELAQVFLQLYNKTNGRPRNDPSFSRVSISRVDVESVDGRKGLARAFVWLKNEGVDSGENFSDELMAHITLRYSGNRWLAQSVQFIPLPNEASGHRNHRNDGGRLRCSGAPLRVRSSGRIKLALAMAVRNEADRYLRRVLQETKHYIDAAAIIDDASEDNTVEVCKEVLADVPLVIHVNRESQFHTEHVLRRTLWDLAGSLNPEWILVLDADQMFETRARCELRPLLDATDVYFYAFRLYDFWDEQHYREDQWWCAHLTYRPFIVRFIPGFEYRWKETPQHCGSFPYNILNLRGRRSSLRVKHFGWARAEDRFKKYRRYLELDPEAKHGIKEQYMTILDPAPKLVKWEEEL